MRAPGDLFRRDRPAVAEVVVLALLVIFPQLVTMPFGWLR
jgi:hypothetical protein